MQIRHARPGDEADLAFLLEDHERHYGHDAPSGSGNEGAAFLTRGGVFSEDLIRTWIDYKRENEADVVRLRPHPAEFSLYYDC